MVRRHAGLGSAEAAAVPAGASRGVSARRAQGSHLGDQGGDHLRLPRKQPADPSRLRNTAAHRTMTLLIIIFYLSKYI